jgi:threonine/homoserine/homoserine lactone efflux protein
MKYIEILLKIAFVGQIVTFFQPLFYENTAFLFFIETAFMLGIVLLLNKKQSYGYVLSHREVIMRRIEGVLLILFAMLMIFTLNQLTNNIIGN